MGLPHPSSDRRRSQPHGSARVDERRRADGLRELVLLKQGQRHLFTCTPGAESTLLDHVRQMARDPQSNINWLDAALISHQVGAGLRQRLGAGAPSHDAVSHTSDPGPKPPKQ